MENIKNSWITFKEKFAQDILPIYENHEETFDYFGFHGRRHITRCLIFAEVMARYYWQSLDGNLDLNAIRMVIALHDAARERNGKDYWEAQSAEQCKSYLLENGYSSEIATTFSNSIIKDENKLEQPFEKIIHDADVLDIMRLFVNTDDGWKKFRTNEFLFLADENEAIRNQLIQEAWQLILETEKSTPKVDNDTILDIYLALIAQNKAKFEFMNAMLI